jgi:hypothetical protein
VTKDQAVAALQDHDFFLKLDPHYMSHQANTAPKKDVVLPDEIKDRARGPTAIFESVDKIPGFAAKLLPGKTSTTNYYQITNTTEGVYIHLNSALDVVMDRELCIREGAGGLELVEKVGINCSKLLMGTVKGSYEEHWRMYHERFIEKMGGQAGESA